MKRWWIALGAVVGLLVIGFLVLTLFIDAESFRQPIEQALTDNTGWDATIGELDFSIFRGMVVAVRNAELAAPGDTSYARVGGRSRSRRGSGRSSRARSTSRGSRSTPPR